MLYTSMVCSHVYNLMPDDCSDILLHVTHITDYILGAAYNLNLRGGGGLTGMSNQVPGVYGYGISLSAFSFPEHIYETH